jgi:hypothetical protein
MTSMTAVSYDEFQAVLRSCRRAWHIEIQDTYNVESEDQHFQDFIEGRPDDYNWLGDWLRFIRELRSAGVAVERARIVSTPHTDYTRWGLVVAEQLAAAGEDIRYLNRDDSRDIRFPSDDFWLLDDDKLVLSVFFDGGRTGGFARKADAGLIERCRIVRDQVWSRAVPFQQYSHLK